MMREKGKGRCNRGGERGMKGRGREEKGMEGEEKGTGRGRQE